MKLVTINKQLLSKYSTDPEFLHKSSRPCVLVIKLKYKGFNYDFAVPLRSNISANTPKNQYFALPPRPSTKPANRHGIHYIKMFPVSKQYLIKYRTNGNTFATLLQNIINKNQKTIVNECQNYLNQFENGNRPLYSTNIDFLLSQLYPNKKII